MKQIELAELAPNADHQLCIVDPKTQELLVPPLCEEVGVLKKIRNVLTRQIQIVMYIWTDGSMEQFTMSRSAYANRRTLLEKLYDMNLSFLDTQENVLSLMNYIMETDKAAPVEYVHDKLGFYTLKSGEMVFLADKMVGLPDVVSHYTGSVATAPKGTVEGWLTGVHELVSNHVNLAFALAISISAPIAHLLREQKVFAEIPIWCFVGVTSSGKTTALRLQESFWADSAESGALIGDLYGTKAWFFATLSERIGLPLILDEATEAADLTNDGIKLVTGIYALSKGYDKGRCKSSGEPNERKKFSGCIVMSSERSVLNQSQVNMGYYARMVELSLRWTDSAEHSRRIVETFAQNCGTAWLPFMEALFNIHRNDPDSLKRMFNQELSTLKKMVGSVSAIGERPLNMFATVMVAANMANEVLKLDLNIPEMRNLIVQLYDEIPKETDLARKLYDGINGYIIDHSGRFPEKDNRGHYMAPPIDQWGERSTENGQKVCWIMDKKFEEAAKAAGFANYTQLLSMMCDRGMIKSFNKGKYRGYRDSKHRLNGIQHPCYCVILE